MRTPIRAAVPALVLAAALQLGTGASPPAAAEPTADGSSARFVTLVAGRSFWEATDPECRAYPDALSVDLGEAAQALAARARPLPVHGTLQGAFTSSSSTRTCGAAGSSFAALYPTWSDTARLRDRQGWTFGSNGRDLKHMTRPERTLAEQWSTSCGALGDLRARGHARGGALFAYPGGGNAEDMNDQVQRDVVSRCFTWSRRYTDVAPFERNQRTDEGSPTANPLGWAWAHNIYGGHCNLPSAPCATRPSHPERTYDSPQELAALLAPAAGEWAVLQFHAFVTGARLSGAGSHWDCTAGDWRAHWTTRPELYCWEDFLSALDAIPADAQVVDPLAVAQAWGRVLRAPAVSGATPARGTGGDTVTLSTRDVRPVGSPQDGYVRGRGLTVRFGGAAARVLDATSTSVRVRVPAGSAGTTVAVTVVNADGTRGSRAGAFTYAAG